MVLPSLILLNISGYNLTWAESEIKIILKSDSCKTFSIVSYSKLFRMTSGMDLEPGLKPILISIGESILFKESRRFKA